MTVKVVHIADVHWRGLSRHQEYKETFELFFKKCKELKPDYIYIGGDIVHSKTQNISPELIHHLSWWFEEMAKISKVVVILGNHDGLMLNMDRMDTVSPIVKALNNPRIKLYKDSGVFPFEDHPGFNWCVLSCFDQDNWKKAKAIKGEINVALYHGAIWGSYTDIDYMLEGDDNLSIFDGYDFAMLGDIHKRQYLDKEKRIWYSGSVIPQNFSEIHQKGFLYWEIENKDKFTVDFFPIEHVQPHITFDWDDDLELLISRMNNIKPGSKIRVRAKERLPYAIARKISKRIRKEFEVTDVVFKYESKSVKVTSNIKDIVKGDILDSRTIKKLLREYNNIERKDNFWSEVDDKVDKLISNSPKLTQQGNRWSIKRLEFDNTFGYGRNNVINFSNLNGIVGLFGRNRAGKSSIPGTIAYGLYNKNDRGITSNLHIINVREDYCQTYITFFANNKYYRVERFSSKGMSRGNETVGTYLNLYEVDSEGSIIKDLSGEQRRETEKVLVDIIGTSSDFLLTTFASQGGMNKFIDLGGSERRRTICRFLGLDIFSEMNRLFKENSMDIKSQIRKLESVDYDGWIYQTKEKLISFESKKEKLEVSLNNFTKELERELINLKDLKSHVKTDIESIDSLERKIKICSNNILNSDKKIFDLLQKMNKIKNIIETSEASLDEEKFVSYGKKIDEYDKFYASIKSLVTSIDSTSKIYNRKLKSSKLLDEVPCGSKFPNCKFISNSHTDKLDLISLEKDINNMKTDVNNIKSNIDSESYNKMSEYYKNYEKRKSKLGEMKLSLSKLELNKERLEYSNKEENIKLLSLKEKLIISQKASDPKLAKEIISTELRVNTNRAGMKLKQSQISEIATKIGINKEKLSNFINDKDLYNELLKEWTVYEFLISATNWKGIPAFILQSMVPSINEELGSILQDTVGFTIELEVDDSKTEIYINYGDSKRPIECGSGMEKMVSSLALRVALTNISSLNKSDMLIIDEGFGSLDSVNVESVTQLLYKLKNWYRLILLISHVDVVKDCVDDIIEITSEGKNSKVIA